MRRKNADIVKQLPTTQTEQTVSIIGSWITPLNTWRFLRSHSTALYASSLNRRSSWRRWLPTSINFC